MTDPAILTVLERIAVAMERQAAALEKSVSLRSAARAGGPAMPDMSDAELDADAKGDQVIKFDPKAWKGPSFIGKRWSETSAEYLETYANGMESRAQWAHEEAGKATDEDVKKKKNSTAHFARLDARRCRAWARRMQAGWKPPPVPEAGQESWRKKPATPAPAASPNTGGYPSSWDEPSEPAAPPAPASQPEEAPPPDWDA